MSVAGTRAIRAATPAAVPRSAATPETCAPAPGAARRTSAVAARTRDSVRPFTMTAAPSRASARAMARPMPAVEPVTTAVLPASCRSIYVSGRVGLRSYHNTGRHRGGPHEHRVHRVGQYGSTDGAAPVAGRTQAHGLQSHARP